MPKPLTQWSSTPQIPVNNASMGTGLKLIFCVNTAISIVRVLKSVPEDSVASLAESLLDIVSDIEHDV